MLPSEVLPPSCDNKQQCQQQQQHSPAGSEQWGSGSSSLDAHDTDSLQGSQSSFPAVKGWPHAASHGCAGGEGAGGGAGPSLVLMSLEPGDMLGSWQKASQVNWGSIDCGGAAGAAALRGVALGTRDTASPSSGIDGGSWGSEATSSTSGDADGGNVGAMQHAKRHCRSPAVAAVMAGSAAFGSHQLAGVAAGAATPWAGSRRSSADQHAGQGGREGTVQQATASRSRLQCKQFTRRLKGTAVTSKRLRLG